MSMEHFYTFYSLKIGKSTSRGNKNKLVICIYLYLYVPFLESTIKAFWKYKPFGLFSEFYGIYFCDARSEKYRNMSLWIHSRNP